MWTVQYRCLYRDHWYDDDAAPCHSSYEDARARAVVLAMLSGRAVRVVDPYGREVVRF